MSVLSPRRGAHTIQPQKDLMDAEYFETSKTPINTHRTASDFDNMTADSKKLKVKSISTGIDFLKLVEEHGYAKARQVLKLRTMHLHQDSIKATEDKIFKKYSAERIREKIRLSSTLGEPSMISTTDKILDMTSESILKHSSTNNSTSVKDNVMADTENALIRNLANGQGKFVMAQSGLLTLPAEIGSTLCLQTSFLRSVSLPRNQLTNLFSIKSSQLASIHFRYIVELNLSDNKIDNLPDDIGNMTSLQDLDMSTNQLTKLPNSFKLLKQLKKLNLKSNRFVDIDYSLSTLNNLEYLNLSSNHFTKIPSVISKFSNLMYFNISDNLLPHLAIIPHVLGPNQLWQEVVDLNSGKKVFYNIITQERYENTSKYKSSSIEEDTSLHVFQSRKSIKEYRRRRLWLSICSIPEWEGVMDHRTGWSYFRNNVSGTTQWEIPEEIDLLGNLKKLEVFIANNNNIRLLPHSFVRMSQLKTVHLHSNRLAELPSDINSMKSLEYLNVNHNDLKVLPSRICQCESLKELHVQSNQIIRLPDQIGNMPKLEVLDVGVNRLKQVAYSLGHCKTLKSLQLFENPLTDPPIEEISKGIESIKWYLRNRSIIEQRGSKPPEIVFHKLGIMNEVTLISSDYNARIQHQLDISKNSYGIVNLQFLGLEELPAQLATVSDVKRLQIDYNPNLKLLNGFIPGEYQKTVRSLSLRACNSQYLPDNLQDLKKLRVLNIEMNLFDQIPASVLKLKALQTLDISKNQVYSVPKEISTLEALKVLNLESNHIQQVPHEISKLTSLVTLNLARNNIHDIPSTFCELNKLRKLDLSNNKLYNLPKDIRNMNLIDLRIDHNRIETLIESLFSYELGKSIKYFSCSENNLQDLPNSIYLIDPEASFYADYNPLISPPPYLLTEGLTSIQKYLKYRQIRTEELETLLHENDFIFVRSYSKPNACEVLDDGLGFLTPDDVAEFDLAVNEYLNGEYYYCPSTAKEIVQELVDLRESRESGLYLTILETFISVLRGLLNSSDENERRMYSESVLTTSTRPWGEGGEDCAVFIISLACLLKDLPPNPIHRTGRHSVFSLLAKAIPAMPFPFTIDLLKDCLRLYNGPYGQVADTERVVFPSCDCYDDRRRRPCNHSPCEKPAVIIVQTIYTEQEAIFREVEEDEYFGHFNEITTDIKAWLRTSEGRHELEKETTRRRNNDIENLRAREELVVAEENKLKEAQESLRAWTRRKQLKQSGAAFETHGLYEVDEAIKNIALEEEKIARCATRADGLKRTVAKASEDIKKDINLRKMQMVDDLMLKYCSLQYQSTIHVCREICLAKKLRRPWDGIEGQLFAEWMKTYVPTYGRSIADIPLEKALDEATEKVRASKAAIYDGPEYNWDKTNDMSIYHFDLYEKFKQSKLKKRRR